MCVHFWCILWFTFGAFAFELHHWCVHVWCILWCSLSAIAPKVHHYVFMCGVVCVVILAQLHQHCPMIIKSCAIPHQSCTTHDTILCTVVAQISTMGKRGASSSSTSHVQGGHRQKLAWAERSTEQASSGGSALSELLLRNWAWGHMSTPMLQSIAQAACKDGSQGHDIRFLASLGSAGLYPGNMHQELQRRLCNDFVSQSLTSVHVFMKKANGGGIVGTQHAMLLPHELFATLHQHYPDKFKDHILGGNLEKIKRFWASMTEHPSYQSHPCKQRADHTTRCVPLGLHGDGVAISGVGRSWAKSVDVYSWGVIAGKGLHH